SGEFWNLNPTAAVVLRALLAGDTAQTAARALTDEFAVDTGTAEADVTSLVGALRAAHLLDGEPAR
ncbi:MAG TPA: lasso peptide biosynthesis PqqD family chaperone, partial [Micromonosporaceae bacterium]|nr:lasso peptide biosynthesis PqqD family chaperone [Micromonosporaceae bacterium]